MQVIWQAAGFRENYHGHPSSLSAGWEGSLNPPPGNAMPAMLFVAEGSSQEARE